MKNDQYPSNTVQELLKTDLVSQNTATILNTRLEQPIVKEPTFFDKESFEILKAVSPQLIPQTDRLETIDLAGMLDEQLAAGKGNGWRYNEMPPDNEAFKSGLKGIDETSEAMFGDNFTDLDDAEQDSVLLAIQKGEAQGQTWGSMSSKLFFEELLAALTELYYSHPTAKNEIGDTSFADAKGWDKIGLNELNLQEPKSLSGPSPSNHAAE